MQKRGILFWILLLLFGIGIAKSFLVDPVRIAIPLLVFGTIVYFYRHPEKVQQIFYRSKNHRTHSTSNKNKKKSPFTVIKGNKEDDYPKYH